VKPKNAGPLGDEIKKLKERTTGKKLLAVV
jgi:hypothetical protein